MRVGDEAAVTGLDPTPGMLAVAERLAPGVEWRQGPAESLPYEDDSFDALCDHSRSLAVGFAMQPLGGIPGLNHFRDPVHGAMMAITEALESWFCGDGTAAGSPPAHTQEITRSDPRIQSGEPCNQAAEQLGHAAASLGGGAGRGEVRCLQNCVPRSFWKARG